MSKLEITISVSLSGKELIPKGGKMLPNWHYNYALTPSFVLTLYFMETVSMKRSGSLKLNLEYPLISSLCIYCKAITHSQSAFFQQMQVQPHVSVGKRGGSWEEVGVWSSEQVE